MQVFWISCMDIAHKSQYINYSIFPDICKVSDVKTLHINRVKISTNRQVCAWKCTLGKWITAAGIAGSRFAANYCIL